MSGHTLHTERGDVTLTRAQMRLYRALTADRFRVYTTAELCRALGTARTRELDTVAVELRQRIADATGLRLVQSVWGIGYRLEHLPPEHQPPREQTRQPTDAAARTAIQRSKGQR